MHKVQYPIQTYTLCNLHGFMAFCQKENALPMPVYRQILYICPVYHIIIMLFYTIFFWGGGYCYDFFIIFSCTEYLSYLF